MEKLVLVEKNTIPNDPLIMSIMKDSYPFYEQIFSYFKSRIPNSHTEWKYYGKKNGWLLKHIDENRNMFFLVIYEDYFKISFTFKDKTVSDILTSDKVSNNVKSCFDNAKKYVEGTTILFTVKSKSDVDDAIQLINYKMAK